MTSLKSTPMERLEIEVNIRANNEIQPAKVITKIYDALKEIKFADSNTELKTEPQWSIHVTEKKEQEANKLHIVLFDDVCHLSLEATKISKSWLDGCSSLVDKIVLLLSTYNFSIKSVEVECSFDVNELFFPLETLINDSELGKLVNKANMPLTPVSLMFLSKFAEWDAVIIAPKQTPEEKEEHIPTNLILHKDSPKHQEGIIANVYQAAMAFEAKLQALKTGDAS